MQREPDSISRRRLLFRCLIAGAITLVLAFLFRSGIAGLGVVIMGGIAILFGLAALLLPLIERVGRADALLVNVILPLADASSIAAAAVFAGPHGAAVFPLYVLAVLDHGVHGGIKAMFISVAANLLGIAIVFTLADYSRDLIIAAIASILVPLSFAPAIRRFQVVRNEAVSAVKSVEQLRSIQAAVYDRLQTVSARISDLLTKSRSKAETNLLKEAYESTTQMLEAAAAAASGSESAQPVEGRRGAAVDAPAYDRGTPLKVLIVDDNSTNLMVLKRILLSAGYVVTVTSSGREALEAIATGDYAAAVIDIHMPEFDGLKVVRQFRRDHPRSALAIIVVTADESFDAQSGSADAGADAYLTKPVKPAKLLSTIRQVLRARKVVYLARGQRVPEGATSVLDEDTFREIQGSIAETAEQNTLIQIFEGEMQQLLGWMEQAVKDNDGKGLGDALDAARAAALSIGAFRLAKSCEAIKTGNPPLAGKDAGKEVLVLHEEYGLVVKRLREIVKKA